MKLLKMFAPVIAAFEKDAAAVKPATNVAEFMFENISILFDTEAEIDDELQMLINQIVRGAFVAEANQNPQFVLEKVQKFIKAFAAWGIRERIRKDER